MYDTISMINKEKETMTKAQQQAAELVEKFGRDDAIKTAHFFLCTVSAGKKDHWRKVKASIVESK